MTSEQNAFPKRDQDKPELKSKKALGLDKKADQIRLACPFSKHNPDRYSEVHGRACTNGPGLDISHLQEHLNRVHSIVVKTQCPMCKQPWRRPKGERFVEVTQHCQHSLETVRGQPEFMTEIQEAACEVPISTSGKTVEEVWVLVYVRLFPNSWPVPSPYYDYYTPTHQINSRDTSPPLRQAHGIFATDDTMTEPQNGSPPWRSDARQAIQVADQVPRIGDANDAMSLPDANYQTVIPNLTLPETDQQYCPVSEGGEANVQDNALNWPQDGLPRVINLTSEEPGELFVPTTVIWNSPLLPSDLLPVQSPMIMSEHFVNDSTWIQPESPFHHSPSTTMGARPIVEGGVYFDHGYTLPWSSQDFAEMPPSSDTNHPFAEWQYYQVDPLPDDFQEQLLLWENSFQNPFEDSSAMEYAAMETQPPQAGMAGLEEPDDGNCNCDEGLD